MLKIFEYSTDSNNSKLNPDFVTGLTDAEGCFSVNVYSSKTAKFKRRVELGFTIKMLDNETELLKMVETFFNCGNLWHYPKDDTIRFRIVDKSSIKNKLIPHFLKYPLRGTKHLDFLSFKEAFQIIESKEHLTEWGLHHLCLLSKSMNTGREFPIDYCNPNYIKENNLDYIPINGHYVNGFIAGDGCLTMETGKNFGCMRLSISQHINNKLLMESIAKYFKSPSKVYPRRSKGLEISLGGTLLWENVIFKHFEQYPMYGTKKLKLDNMFKTRELKRNNEHLIQIRNYKQWKPDYKLRIKDIWNK